MFSALTLPLFLFAASGVSAQSPVLRTADETAHALFGREFIKSHFSLTARVSYVRHRPWLSTMALAVEDKSGPVVLHIPTHAAAFVPKAGDVVRFHGQTEMPQFPRTCALVDGMELVSHGPPPDAQPASVGEVLSGAFDCRLVRTTGTVRDVCRCDLNPQWTILVIGGEGRILYSSIPTQDPDIPPLEALIGATVSVTGIPVPSDLSERSQIGRTFKIADRESIAVVRSPPQDPQPLPDIREIRNLRPEEIAALPRHRAVGRVLAVWGTGNALIRTDDGLNTRVEFAKDPLPACNDRIEVRGFPESDFFHVNLIRASWRKLSAETAIPDDSERISPLTLMTDRTGTHRIDPNYHGRCIRIRGRVVGLPSSETGNTRAHLSADGTVFPVETSPGAGAFDGIELGSELEVTGTCVMETENWRPNSIFMQVKGFFIVPRTAADIRVVATPPWWTVGRLLGVIGALLASLVAIFFWNLSLRRLAEKRGRNLLREQIEREKAALKTEERTRLAIELHDTLAQNLTGVSMELEAAKRLSGNGKDALLPHLELGARTLKSCRDELRNCLWDLRSRALEESDMNEAVARTLKPYADRLGITIRFNVPRRRLSDNLVHGLLRIIRELVINATRHGKATNIQVAGTLEGNRLLCSVRDDGVGFDPDNAPGILLGHFGLHGIRERASQIGGAFSISSSPGKGTYARITLELDKIRNPTAL